MTPPVLSVSQLNAYVKSIIDGDENLAVVFVNGEISNFTNHYRTGHFYMTIKDAGASIKAVMFRSSNQRLRFVPENGMSVLLRGRVSIYERDGQYQLYIDDMQPDGAGALALAFEQMKRRLGAQGLFDEDHKKPIPRCPTKIGVVTSPTGAAVRDIINVLSRRFPLAQVVLCPVQVQGEAAAGQIAQAIADLNSRRLAEVIIVGRGGGSAEDLWAFNEEGVARAVYASDIPVISAVGHETDFTICDFVADLRAPTPSAAAELAVPDAGELKTHVAALSGSAKRSMEALVSRERTRLRLISASRALSSPAELVDVCRQHVDSLFVRAETSLEKKIAHEKPILSALAGRLDTMSPLKVLERGYALVGDGEGVADIEKIAVGDNLIIRLKGGTLYAQVTRKEETTEWKK